METSRKINWMTKEQVANHFQIGVRTVTKLMNARLFPYVKVRNLVRFDLNACERAFRFFGTADNIQSADPPGGQWKTKRQMAAHLSISERTVTALMRQRVLAFVKLRRILRFDLGECDSAFRARSARTVLEHRLGIAATRERLPDGSSLASASG
jgi:hypothetical protein